MSMARTSSWNAEDDMDPLRLPPTKARPRTSTEPAGPVETLVDDGEHEDLVSRTRRSMAGFEAARQKAQLERRRSQRRSKVVPRKDSYFPRVEEETLGDISVAEELLETGQEDVEAVFRSRPRIKTSPAPSPSRRLDEEQEEW